ncbi:SMC domain protein [Thermoanaerobacterium thermosaccharolyticum]|uniref:SMC domain protein n=1 Tax=Thermoanaerobacterium thermosaccharolyticum TaxID=1517 RepID=A0A223I030_THETR|nr:hypothetical protein [Thermoanaerobacterium thermosaccharolyticum]AST58061.1 SMC domain protein [Thermoanaerobacterium thermosaccharolyticum]
MNTIVKKEIEDISASYDLLEDSLENLKNKILQEYIPDCSKNDQVEEIRNALQILEQVKSHMEELAKLRNSYNQVFGSYIHSNNEEDNEEIEEESEKDIKDVADRTTWKRENENIRIETTRPDGSSSYPNIIPVHIFEEIVKTIVDQFVRYNKDYIKTSTISALLNDKIMQETNYKKSPKTLVYSVIKILIKEDILENKENYKRMYVLKKSPEYISKWLKNI